jgi:hypothetical protein
LRVWGFSRAYREGEEALEGVVGGDRFDSSSNLTDLEDDGAEINSGVGVGGGEGFRGGNAGPWERVWGRVKVLVV